MGLDKLQRVSRGGFALFRRAAPISGPYHCTVWTPKARTGCLASLGRAGQGSPREMGGTGTSQVPPAPGTWSVPQMLVPPTKYIDRRPFLDMKMTAATWQATAGRLLDRFAVNLLARKRERKKQKSLTCKSLASEMNHHRRPLMPPPAWPRSRRRRERHRISVDC